MSILNIKKAVIVGMVMTTIFFLALIVLLTATVRTTVTRDTLGDEIPELVREVATLESAYLEKRGEITLATIESGALIQNNEVEYVTRRQAVSFASSVDN